MNDERKTPFEDELLDRALEHQRVEEPRPGLEGRVLARLETASSPRGNWLLKACVVAVPATLLIVLAVYLFRSPVNPPTIAPEPPRIVESSPPAAVVPEPPDPVPAPPPIVKEKVQAASTRSPTFPSHDGLSPQEALLVRFVRNTPKETLHAAAERPSAAPLQIEELSVPELQVEPLPAADPLSAS